MYALNLKFHATSQDVLFPTMEEAMAALDALKPKMGSPYSTNSQETHEIVCPSGRVVVVCAKIEAATVVNIAENDRLAEAMSDDRERREIEFHARKARAIEQAKKD